MTISTDVLQDFIDGKLPPGEAGRIAGELAHDPEMAAYVEHHKASRALLSSPPVLRLKRWSADAAHASAAWIPAAAVAAGIGLGVLLAGTYGIGTNLRSETGSLVAQGELAQALTSQLWNEQSRSAAQIGASFWSKNGAFCRSFALRGNTESAMTGIACRERGAWRIVVAAAVAPEEVPFPLAPAALPPSVRGVMDNLIVGQTLEAEAERQARSQGWRVR